MPGSKNSLDWVGIADVIVGLLALGVALATVWIQRSKSEFGFSVLLNRSLSFHGQTLKPEISHNGILLAEPHWLTIRVANSGYKTIRQEDFDTPIRLEVSDAKIAAAEVTFASPSDLGVQVSFTQSIIQLSPTLWNPRDLVEIQVLADGQAKAISASGRIAGISEIAFHTVPRDSWGQPWRIGLGSVATAWLMILGFVGVGAYIMIAEHSVVGTIFGGAFFIWAAAQYPLTQLNKLRASNLYLR